MQRISEVDVFKPAPTFEVAPEVLPTVVFPTIASWHEYIMTHPDAPRGSYCKYGCGGAGYMRYDVPFGHPLFGKVARCQCKKDAAAMADEDKLREYRDTLSPIEQTFTLDNWIGKTQDPESLQLARQAVAQGWGMFCFWGDVGRAKSGLLAGIVNEALEKKWSTVYAVATMMLDDLRASYETETFEQEMNRLRGVKVLALDEMWRFKQTEWAQEKVFQLLDYRYRYWDRLLTVVATNAEPNTTDPLWSRFSDRTRGKIQQVKGDDVRPFV